MNRHHPTETAPDKGLTASRRFVRPTALTAAVVIAAGAAAYETGVFVRQPSAAAPAASGVPTATAPVRRADVAAHQEISGTLGYAGSFTVTNQTPAGILTWLPAPGAVIPPGARLYAVDGAPVVLLAGTTPAWRAFTPGMTDGPDVTQLKRNLVDLGFDPQHVLSVDEHFTPGTRAAVVRLQAALGLPADQRTGTLALGSAVFLPDTVRITAVTGQPGGTAATGAAVATATSTRRAVTAQLTLDQRTHVHVGDTVGVALPDGTRLSAAVAALGTSAAQNPAAGGGSGGAQAPTTVPLTIDVVNLLPAEAGLDAAPVQIDITTAIHHGVLTAPITALLAGPAAGTYQVHAVFGGQLRTVTVTTGLFDDITANVEIAGPGLTDATTVEVPAP